MIIRETVEEDFTQRMLLTGEPSTEVAVEDAAMDFSIQVMNRIRGWRYENLLIINIHHVSYT